MEEMNYEGISTHEHIIHLAYMGIEYYTGERVDTLESSNNIIPFCSSKGGMVRYLLHILSNYLQEFISHSLSLGYSYVIHSYTFTSVLRMHTHTIHLLFWNDIILNRSCIWRDFVSA